jgi:integration host factor subunit beta
MTIHPAGPEGSPPVLSQQLVNKIVEVLIRDGRFEIDNFGVFELRIHKARKGRNPRTGERITIPKKLRIAFRSSRVLQARLSEELARMEKASAKEGHETTGSEMPKKDWWPFW